MNRKISAALITFCVVLAVPIAAAADETVSVPDSVFALDESIQMIPSGHFIASYSTSSGRPMAIEGRAGESIPAPSTAPDGFHLLTPGGGHLRVWPGPADRRGKSALRYAWAEPGSAFGPSAALAGRHDFSRVEVVVGASGHAAIAIVERGRTERVRISRASPGGRFSRPGIAWIHRRPGTIDIQSLSLNASGAATLLFDDMGTVCLLAKRPEKRCRSTHNYARILTLTPGGRLIKARGFGSCSTTFPVAESPQGSAVVPLECGRLKSFVAYSFRLPDGRFSGPRRVSPASDRTLLPMAAFMEDGRAILVWENSTISSGAGVVGFATTEAVAVIPGGSTTPVVKLFAPQRWDFFNGPANPNPRLVRSESGIPFLLWPSEAGQLQIARINGDLTLGPPLALGATPHFFAEAAVAADGNGIVVRSFFPPSSGALRHELISFRAP